MEKFEYNAAHGQLSRYTAADGAEWQYRYDERGLLSNITDPAGQTWTQQCDERGLAGKPGVATGRRDPAGIHRSGGCCREYSAGMNGVWA
ncbi:RHS repeat protein [Escherichia coli]|nr:RHS repeat protein [Escherichia coli]